MFTFFFSKVMRNYIMALKKCSDEICYLIYDTKVVTGVLQPRLPINSKHPSLRFRGCISELKLKRFKFSDFLSMFPTKISSPFVCLIHVYLSGIDR